MNLTDQQRAAIHRTGQDVCVIAGPGSGKTRVLAERFAWLVTNQNVSPRNILALTFTEKAANEIKSRVSKTKHPEIDFAPISTFHSLCTRILKEFSVAAGLDPATEMWDERVVAAELRATVEEILNDAAHNETAALRKLFTTWNTQDIVDDLCALYERIRGLSENLPQPEAPPDIPDVLAVFIDLGGEVANAQPSTPPSRIFHEKFCEALAAFRALGTQPSWDHVAALGNFPKRGNLPKGLKEPATHFYDSCDAVRATLVTALVGPERNYLIEFIHRIAERFAERKRAAARMDFSDLEHKAIELLRGNSRVREELQRRFEHILMDEMQDTNPIQWRLLKLLRSPGNFFAVGDSNQGIYGFRFAAPKEFLDFKNELQASGGEIDYLGENFRSREEILHFTESVSKGLKGLEAPGLIAGRKFRTQNLPVSVHAFEQSDEELEWLATEIECLKETFLVEPKNSDTVRRLALNDVAILVRTTVKAEAIAAVLAERQIPYTLGGGRKFFDTQEVADCISYLELLANPLNTIAKAAVLRSPLVGLTDDQLLANETNPRFDSRLEGQRARLDDVSPDRFLTEALDASGYVQTLNPGGRANVEKFLRIARELWQQGPCTMRDFVSEIAQMRSAAKEKSAPVTGSGEAVQILTVHASKGLEFPVVFVAGVYFSGPGFRSSLTFAAPARIGVRWTNPIDGKSYPDLQAKGIEAELKVEEEDELQRQLYVALTRAEQKLYVSWAGTQKRGWVKYLHSHTDLSYQEGEALPLPVDSAQTPQRQLTELRPMVPQHPVLSSATPTDVAKFALCPRKFFLDELAGLDAWPSEDVNASATDLGSAVHQILAGQPVENDSPEARELAQVFLDSPTQNQLASATWIEREFDIVFAIKDLVLQGQIDLCFEAPHGEITIIDYKTDWAVSKHYDSQMAIYRAAMSRLYPGKRVRSFLHFLRSGQLIEATAPLDRKLIRAFQTGENFSTRPGVHCQRCPHLGKACPVTA